MRPPRLPPLGALRAFHAVARHRSFKQAAEALGVSATAVSHQIKLLESVLECRVCERSAQGVSLTADGEILYAATQRAFSALEQAVVQIAHARQPPSLTVTTTSNFLTHWLVPRLADFTARFPAIDLRLHTSVERVDLHLGTVDAAIRYRETSERDLYCTLLYEDRFIVVASPTLGLSRPEDLQRVTLFHVANRRVPADSPSWENWRRRYGPPTLNIDAGLQRGKGFINRDAVIVIGDRQQKLPLFPVVRQLAQQVINGLHRLLWNIQHHWFKKYFFLLLVKSAIL